MGRLYEKGGRLCRRGHVKEGANLYITLEGWRVCVTCKNHDRLESYWRKREMALFLAKDFTSRERDVWRLVYLGFSNQEIADHEHIARKYVENVVSTLYEKTGLGGDEFSRRIRLARLYKEPLATP